MFGSHKNGRCGMIVHETATHQIAVEFKLLQVPLWTSTRQHLCVVILMMFSVTERFSKNKFRILNNKGK